MGKKQKQHSHDSADPQGLDGILASLRAQGCRITTTRRQLLDLIVGAPCPSSVPELIAKLAKRGTVVNKATVYRELDFLLDRKIVREIDLLDGLKRYELLHPDDHHHHLVCNRCKRIQCVELHNDLDAIEKRISRNHGFRIQSHVLEFFGVCGECLSNT